MMLVEPNKTGSISRIAFKALQDTMYLFDTLTFYIDITALNSATLYIRGDLC